MKQLARNLRARPVGPRSARELYVARNGVIRALRRALEADRVKNVSVLEFFLNSQLNLIDLIIQAHCFDFRYLSILKST